MKLFNKSEVSDEKDSQGSGVGNSAQAERDKAERSGSQIAVVTAVVLLILFGVYWGGTLFLIPKEDLGTPETSEEEAIIDSAKCDNPKIYTSIDDSIDDSQSICKLDLSGQELTALSPYIGNFTNLVELDVSNNKLESLPPELGWVRKLQKFDASDNNLAALPPHIGWLRELKVWDLSNNQLSSLPPEIGWLRKMETLNLSNNQLSSMPIEMGWMSQMKTLDLSGNPAAIRASAKNLRSYMRNTEVILP